jgi:hypothetical protein
VVSCHPPQLYNKELLLSNDLVGEHVVPLRTLAAEPWSTEIHTWAEDAFQWVPLR